MQHLKNQHMKRTLLLLVFFGSVAPLSAQDATQAYFKSPAETVLLATDLHIHTVFSDGSVWPDIRVQEALREGLDLISLTEHLEYQPHKKDIPHPDRNRSFEVASGHLGNNPALQLINGSEITRNMAPGHINAVFIQDANKLLHKDSLTGIVEANKQGAFVFWNHPHWTAQRPDGIAKLDPFHEELISKKLLHGIEVVNEITYSEEAFQLALDNDLTILGTSDIHGLVDWMFQIPEGGHRPMTFVLAKEKSPEAVKKALLKGATVVWFNNFILGKAEHINRVVQANLTAEAKGYFNNTSIARVALTNHSALPLQLEYLGALSFQKNSRFITLPPHQTIELEVRTGTVKKQLTLNFKIQNAWIGPKQNPILPLKVYF